MATFNASACMVHFSARRVSRRASASGAKAVNAAWRNHPSQTLSPTPFSHAVHAVVPVAGPDERKAMPAQRQALVEGERAMLEQRRALSRDRRQEEVIRLVRRQWGAFEERNGFVEHERVSRRLDILRDRVGEPGAVVGNPGPNALAGMGQPPMLHVTLDELPRRRAKQVLARQIGPSGGERHAILQLIAKSIGAAGLIEGGARPDAAGERLIEQPAVQHDVHRPVGSLDLDGAQGLFPKASRLLLRGRRDRRSDSVGSSRGPPRAWPRRRGRRRCRPCRPALSPTSRATRRKDPAPAPTILESGVELVRRQGWPVCHYGR